MACPSHSSQIYTGQVAAIKPLYVNDKKARILHKLNVIDNFFKGMPVNHRSPIALKTILFFNSKQYLSDKVHVALNNFASYM